MYRIPIVTTQLVRERTIPSEFKRLTDAESAARLFHAYLGSPDREHFLVMLLNTKHDVIGISTVSIGTLDASIVHPREVFKPAFLASAQAIIVAHNHPSGDLSPSPEDLAVTRRLNDAAKLLGIDLLDHLILGMDPDFTSLRGEGYL